MRPIFHILVPRKLFLQDIWDHRVCYVTWNHILKVYKSSKLEQMHLSFKSRPWGFLGHGVGVVESDTIVVGDILSSIHTFQSWVRLQLLFHIFINTFFTIFYKISNNYFYLSIVYLFSIEIKRLLIFKFVCVNWDCLAERATYNARGLYPASSDPICKEMILSSLFMNFHYTVSFLSISPILFVILDDDFSFDMH